MTVYTIYKVYIYSKPPFQTTTFTERKEYMSTMRGILYNKFFQLYNNAPNMSYLFMSYVADAMRWRGLRCMTSDKKSSASGSLP